MVSRTRQNRPSPAAPCAEAICVEIIHFLSLLLTIYALYFGIYVHVMSIPVPFDLDCGLEWAICYLSSYYTYVFPWHYTIKILRQQETLWNLFVRAPIQLWNICFWPFFMRNMETICWLCKWALHLLCAYYFVYQVTSIQITDTISSGWVLATVGLLYGYFVHFSWDLIWNANDAPFPGWRKALKWTLQYETALEQAELTTPGAFPPEPSRAATFRQAGAWTAVHVIAAL